jgi:hypothetical protein
MSYSRLAILLLKIKEKVVEREVGKNERRRGQPSRIHPDCTGELAMASLLAIRRTCTWSARWSVLKVVLCRAGRLWMQAGRITERRIKGKIRRARRYSTGSIGGPGEVRTLDLMTASNPATFHTFHPFPCFPWLYTNSGHLLSLKRRSPLAPI